MIIYWKHIQIETKTKLTLFFFHFMPHNMKEEVCIKPQIKKDFKTKTV